MARWHDDDNRKLDYNLRAISHARHLGCEMAESAGERESLSRLSERNRREIFLGNRGKSPPPSVNYLVIECEEAESHRLNYHSCRATGGLIVYRHHGGT